MILLHGDRVQVARWQPSEIGLNQHRAAACTDLTKILREKDTETALRYLYGHMH